MTSRLIVWLALQLLAMGIVVLRIPVAAQYPEPAEKLALHLLLSVQIVGVAMLFPFLLRDARSTAQILSTALPFQLAATFLAAREIREILPAILFVDAWIVTLAIWSAAIDSGRARLLPSRLPSGVRLEDGAAGALPSRACAIGVAIATCLTLGGGVLRYLRLEFAPDSQGFAFEKISPLASTVASIENEAPTLGGLFLGGIALFGVLTIAVQRHRSRAAKLATSYPPRSPHPAAG